MVAICNLGLSAVNSSISYLMSLAWLQYLYSTIQDTCFFFLLAPLMNVFLQKVKKVPVALSSLSEFVVLSLLSP